MGERGRTITVDARANGSGVGQDPEPAPEPVERKPLSSVKLYKEVLFGTALVVNEEKGTRPFPISAQEVRM